MTRSTTILWRLTAPLLLLAFPTHSAFGSPAADEGWQKLLRNQNKEAEAAFRGAITKDPADIAAYRGLALLRSDEDAEAAALAATRVEYRLHAAGWAALADWPLIASCAHGTGRWDALEAAAQQVLASPGAEPSLRASARLALGTVNDALGRTAAADKQWAALAFVRQWQVVGPFDNETKSGFGRRFGPEEGVDLKRTYRAMDDLELRWRRLGIVGREGQCQVGLMLGGSGAGVYYAATAVYSPAAAEAFVRIDPTGASRVWVNGALVFTDSVYRTPGRCIADPYSAKAPLQAGWNTILVKLADEHSGEAAFALRVTDRDGVAIPGLRVDPSQCRQVAAAPVEKELAAESETIRLLRLLKPAPPVLAAMGDRLWHEGDYAASATALRAALKDEPGSGILHWLLAQALAADDQRDEARAERDLALKANPRLAAARLDALQNGDEEAEGSEQISKLKALCAAFPRSASIAWALADAYSEAQMTAEALQVARKAVRIAPGPDRYDQLVSLLMDTERRDEASKVLAVALKATPGWQELVVSRAMLLADEGKTLPAIDAYARCLRLGAPNPRYRFQIARLYRGIGQNQKALQTLQALRAQSPQDSEYAASLADVLKELGRTNEAAAMYRDAIRLSPGDVELRDKLNVLERRKAPLDLAPAIPAQPALAQAAALKPVAGTAGVVLLNEARQMVYPDGASLARVHLIVKVLDKGAAERWQTLPLNAPSDATDATIETARIIKADGKIQKAEDTSYSGTVSFPSLAAGDTIDLSFRVEDYHRGALARHFWAEWMFNVSDFETRRSRYVLVMPRSVELTVRPHAGAPEPTVRDVDEWRIREWSMMDVPPTKSEANEPGRRDFVPWVDVSTVRSWEEVQRWYTDLSSRQCTPDETVRAKALELTRDAKTEDDKIAAVARFVAREIQYQTTPFRSSAYTPTEGKKVLGERYGDCKDKAALLTAMLAAVGIHSNMALLTPRHEGTLPYLPSPRFAHAVARVQTAAGERWVDATADQMPVGLFPLLDQGVPALVIDGRSAELVTTPVLDDGKETEGYAMDLALDTAGKLTGSMELSPGSDRGGSLRALLTGVPEARHQELLQAFSTLLLKDLTLDGGGIRNVAEPDKPLTVQLLFHGEGYAARAGDFMLCKLPWSAVYATSLTTLGTLPRAHDVELGRGRGTSTFRVKLKLPDGYSLQQVPADVKRELPAFSYAVRYALQRDVLTAECSTTFTTLRVPASDFPAFRALYEKLVEDCSQQLVLKR